MLARVAADAGLVYALRRTAPDFARVCTPANVAWLLSSWAAQVSDDAQLAAGVSGAELRANMEALVVRMRLLALPPT